MSGLDHSVINSILFTTLCLEIINRNIVLVSHISQTPDYVKLSFNLW